MLKIFSKKLSKFIFSKAGIICGVVIFDVVLMFFLFARPVKLQNPSEAAKQVFDTCKNQSRYMDCVGQEFAKIMAMRGFQFITASLFEYQKIDLQTQNCHVIAHKTIQAYTRKNPNAWKDILKSIDPGACGGGFMHGVLEVRIGDDPNFNVNKDLFSTICEAIYTGRYVTSCVHILGHIIFVEKEGNLTESLKVCEGLNGELLFECYGGIFMEDSFRTNFYDHKLGQEPVRNEAWFTRQFARCKLQSDLAEKEAGCFYDVAEVAAQIKNFEIPNTYAVCMTAKSQMARDRCYIRASYVIATAPIPKIDAMDFSDLCTSGHPSIMLKNRCLNDTISALFSYSLLFASRAEKLCSLQEGGYRASCFGEILNQLKGRIVRREERQGYCVALPDPYRSQCMQ